jgi:hypothetical protein
LQNVYKEYWANFVMDEKTYRGVLVTVLVLSLAFLFVSNSALMTGHATDTSTTSNVTILKYLAIDASPALVAGIEFGNITNLPIANQNASHNFDGAGSASQYYINVSTDSNTPVDFCILADYALNNTESDVIPLANESYFYGTTSNAIDPAISNEVSFTTGYASAGTDVAEGSTNYFRFWLDVSAAQPSGLYDNTVSFKGVTTTTGC